MRLDEYVARLPEAHQRSQPSVFWHEIVDRYRPGAKLLPGRSYRPDLLDGEDVDLERLKRLLPGVKEVAKLVKPTTFGIDDKSDWEHLRAIAFLHGRGMLEEYEAFMSEAKVKSSMSSARHWFYARQLVELGGHGDFLEIGAGAGNLAVFLHRMGAVDSYTIIDLPVMLVHSAETIATMIGVEPVMAEPSLPGEFNFIPDYRYGELPDRRFDVAVNVNSFMEMDREARDHYIASVYRRLRRGGLFFNVNRRQRALPLREGGTWDNNPLLYPYQADELILWEEDPFQTATRTSFGGWGSLTVVRASRVVG